MSGSALRQVLSLCLASFPAAGAATSPSAGDPLPARLERGAGTVGSQGAHEEYIVPLWLRQGISSGAAVPSRPGARLRPPAAASLLPLVFRDHPARIRGRAGCEAPGSSSSRYLHVRFTSPPPPLFRRKAGDLTDLQPARGKAGGEQPGIAQRFFLPGRAVRRLERQRAPGLRAALPRSSSLFQQQ